MNNRRSRRKDSTAKAIFQRAEDLGCVVIETPAAIGFKQDKGKPDAFLWHTKCGWQAIETKGPDTPISTEQADLAARVPVHFVRSPNHINAIVEGTAVPSREWREENRWD